MIKLHEFKGGEIELPISDIRRYMATSLPKNGTWIEMNSGIEFRVYEDFDTVDKIVENLKL